MRIFVVALLGVLVIAPLVHARPVSYPGGWTLMLKNDSQRRSAHLHYSPSVKVSLGYKLEDWREKGFTLNAFQMNNLLNRWNKKNSQANLYVKSGLGIVSPDSGTSEVAGFTGVSADWEDRRRFISYQNRYTQAGDVDDFYQQSVRVGWAPYVGNYGDLHTWLMLEVKHTLEAEDNFKVTPFVRLFKHIHLVEAGVSYNGDVMLNYIYRY